MKVVGFSRQWCSQLWDVVVLCCSYWEDLEKYVTKFVFTICLRQTSATWRSECENFSSRNHPMHVPEDWHSNFQHTKFRSESRKVIVATFIIYGYLWLFKGLSERRVTLKPLIHHFPPSHCHLMIFYEHWPSQQPRTSESATTLKVFFSKQK